MSDIPAFTSSCYVKCSFCEQLNKYVNEMDFSPIGAVCFYNK
jgi:hypothetical protein